MHDVLRAMGRRNFTLPQRLRPLNPEGVLTGPAFTIEGRMDETADAHQTLLAWTGLLSKAPPGHIWISQPHNHIVAQMGELSAETLHRKGVLGCVTDGGLRDTNFILRLGFPCWGVFHTPRDVVGCWLPTATDVPILIDDVLIRPGDWLHGDRDGMVCIPAEILDEVAEQIARRDGHRKPGAPRHPGRDGPAGCLPQTREVLMLTDPRLMLLSPGDTVYVLRDQIAAGETVMVDGRGRDLSAGAGSGPQDRPRGRGQRATR